MDASQRERAFEVERTRKVNIFESLEYGTSPCLPGRNGYADTAPAVNAVTGERYRGESLLVLKDFQQRNNFPTAEFIRTDQVDRAFGPCAFNQKYSAKALRSLSEGGKDYGDKDLFNVAQLVARDGREIKAPLSVKTPGPEITCSSTDPAKYLGQYFAAVETGGRFKVSPKQAKEFAANMKKSLTEPLGNGYGDPFKLSKICEAANLNSREIVKEIVKEQRTEQKLEHGKTHSRSL